MPSQQSTWGRLWCRLQGEVSAETLEAYQRTSPAVYDLLDQVEHTRLLCKADGCHPWNMPHAAQAHMLCSWNAFVLQNLGNKFLEADYSYNPTTVGFVPPITADQILTFYTQVESWLSRAQEAHSNPNYRLDVAVPAALPPWSEVEPCPNTHLHGMLNAMASIRDHITAAMLFMEQSEKQYDDKQLATLHTIRQMHAAAATKARYAEDLHGSNPSQDVHERAEPFIKEAIEKFYVLGQYLAMPSLVAEAKPKPQPAKPTPMPPPQQPKRPPLPGQSGFDPWCLTNPDSVAYWKSDPQAHHAIKLLWELDPNPAKTLAIHQEIKEAMARGDIGYAKNLNGSPVGHFFCCPWGPVYMTRRPITIANRPLRSMQEFIFDVSAEGMNLGGHFKRELMMGPFRATERAEYGDPNEPPDH